MEVISGITTFLTVLFTNRQPASFILLRPAEGIINENYTVRCGEWSDVGVISNKQAVRGLWLRLIAPCNV